MNIKREGEPDDPVEGSNVTLICDFRGYKYPHSPNWFYLNSSTGEYHQLNFANASLKNDEKLNETVKISEQPKKGLTQNCNGIYIIAFDFLFISNMNADIQIETETSYDTSQDWQILHVYNITLFLKNVTLDSPYTKFKCQMNDTLKEISFKVKGIKENGG